MSVVLKARLHETESIDMKISLRDSDPLGSVYDFLLVITWSSYQLKKEFDVAREDVKFYYNGELVQEPEEVLWNAAMKEDFIDIITPESIVYVSLNCADSIVTLCVPGKITLEEINAVIIYQRV